MDVRDARLLKVEVAICLSREPQEASKEIYEGIIERLEMLADKTSLKESVINSYFHSINTPYILPLERHKALGRPLQSLHQRAPPYRKEEPVNK